MRSLPCALARWPAVALAALAAACNGDHQVVIELTGAVQGAERLEVVLLEPVVLAKEQRHNDPVLSGQGTTLETVFYMAERSRTQLSLEGAATDGFQLEIRGAGGPYVPLVVALSGEAGTAAEQLLALGVYDPASISAAQLGREHAPSAVSAMGDVAIFPIQLEPVDRVLAPAPAASAPSAVRVREVLRVSCPDAGPVSGFVWRRADGAELRVLLPLAGKSGADRLEPPDLDCDQHSPGRAALVRTNAGDQRDCDDTSSIVHAAVRERCSKLDEDCNLETTLSPVQCSVSCPSAICACDDVGSIETCLPAATSGPCKLPSMSSGAQGRQVCDSVGTLKLAACAAGCEVLLAWAPEGLEVSISDEPGGEGARIGKWVPLADAAAFLSVHGTRGFTEPALPVIARVKVGGVITSIAIPLAPIDAACASPSTFECPIL